MTKTEEKAKEWSENHFDEDYRGAAFISYVKGADDQRSIDIDKAYQWLKRNTPIKLMAEEKYEFLEDFKIAMNE